MTTPTPAASRPTAEPRPAASAVAGGDLAGLFDRIPRVDAVRRPPRFGGLAGWTARHWLALAAASVAMFGLLGGFGERPGWSQAWTLIVAAASLVGGFIGASYVPRQGTRPTLSTCGALPLVGTLLVPGILNPADLTTGAVGLGLLVVLAARRASGDAC